MTTIFIILFIYLVFWLYFLPSIVAHGRKHHNFGSILVINLFLGWTFIGWVVAFAMAFSQVRSNDGK